MREDACEGAVKPRRKRRSQAERSAETRRRVLEAATEHIYAHGYAATSNAKVAKAAKVSNGAMVHQYPSKDDLMVDVVRAAYESFHEELSDSLEQKSDIRALYDVPEILWRIQRGPRGTAATEIFLAARGNPALAARLMMLAEEYEVIGQRRMIDLKNANAIEQSNDEAAMERIMVAAIRGLAIESLFRQSDEYPEREMALLTRLYEQISRPLQNKS